MLIHVSRMHQIRQQWVRYCSARPYQASPCGRRNERQFRGVESGPLMADLEWRWRSVMSVVWGAERTSKRPIATSGFDPKADADRW